MTTFTSLNELDLVADTDYSNTTMVVTLNDGNTYPINRTSKKMVFYVNGEDIKRTTLKKITSVSGCDEKMTTKTATPVIYNDLGFGILSHTDYKDSGIVIVHKNLGEMTLVKTSEKMLFVLDSDNNLKRMNPSMMVDTTNILNDLPSNDAEKMTEELEDEFFDNDFIQASFQNDTTDTGIVYD